MKRLGNTYKVAGFFNPLGICYPAEVVPVYRLHNDTSDRGKMYLQICDQSGVVEDFQEVRDTSKSIVLISDGKFNSVDQPAVYGFAFSSMEAVLIKGLPDYLEFLTDALRGPRRRLISGSPIAGVEMARKIENEKLEAVFTSMAVVHLSRAGGSAVRGWLKNAPLSKIARERGYRKLARLVGSDKAEAEVIDLVSAIFISDYVQIQGNLIRVFDDGRVEIDAGGRIYRGWPAWNFERRPLNDVSMLGALRDMGDIPELDIIRKLKLMKVISEISEQKRSTFTEIHQMRGGIMSGQ